MSSRFRLIRLRGAEGGWEDGAQILREERTPPFTTQPPREEDGEEEETELGEIRVLAQGHTAGG